jgi:putative ABC transport system substrate-binding protein
MLDIGRREFISLLGGAAAAWPLAVRAQQAAISVIGFLSGRSPNESQSVVKAFREGLREGGFVEGENLFIAFRWAEGRYDRLPALAAELVGLRVALLFAAGGTASALAAKASTSTIPIVFSAVGDPIGAGLIASLNRPGGNVTGMSVLAPATVGKRIELLRQLVPHATSIGYLRNPFNPSSELESNEALAAADALRIQVHVLDASTDDEFNMAFAALANARAGGLVIAIDASFDSQRDKLVALSSEHRIATIYGSRLNVVAGGLISYGPSFTDLYYRAGVYSGRVLKGEKPANLPVQQPTKFELVINLKTAKALGITIPEKLLTLADEVIE